MFNVGPLELIVVLIIALIVLGPQRLPEVARSVGRGVREFRDSLERDDYEDEDEAHEPEAITPGPHEPDAEPDPDEPHEGAHVADGGGSERAASTADGGNDGVGTGGSA